MSKNRVLLLVVLAVGACAPKPVEVTTGGVATPAAPPPPDTCPARASAPERLPDVDAAHLTLDYWLERTDALDDVLLTPTDIRALNASYAHPDNVELARTDLRLVPSEADVLAEVNERLAWMAEKVRAGDYVDAAGAPLDGALQARLAPWSTVALLDEVRIAEGLVPVRCAPFEDVLLTPALDGRFDRNNCSTLRAGEPVRVLARRDGMALVRAGYTTGWVGSAAALSAPVSAASLPAAPAPSPLTRRALLSAAFDALGAPYGWGGQDGGQDCSRFLMDTFARFGLTLPRFSAHQAQAGSFSIDVSEVPSETERGLLIDAAARRGAVLLHFPGHVMLYLGRADDGRQMAIHAFAEYLVPCETPDDDVETLFEVDRVTVSDLNLGRGSSRTAFIERLTRITVLGGTPGTELDGVAERRRPAPLAAGEGAECPGDDDVFLIVNPRRPNAQQPLRVIATAGADFGAVEVVFTDPDGRAHRPTLRRLGGPPYAVVAEIDAPAPGDWQIAMGESGRVLECEQVRVAHRRPDEGVGAGAVWDVRHNWSAGYENLYATFVESLFDYPVEEDRTWTSLHELTRDPARNLLFDYYGEEEELTVDLEPDCADLPYMLRAYFAWKMGLPFGFRQCSRGRAGRPPRCDNLRTNLMSRTEPGDVDAFAYFAHRTVRSGVHSASGRTHPDDDETDYYPIELSRESLRPGTLYADPYGHLLIVAGWQAQGTDDYGILIGADAQPDGTVGRRRFWRGSFLFSPDTTDVGAGFKAYRPVRYSRSTGEVTSYTNDMLRDDPNFAPYSREQYTGSVDDFYGRMEAIINPRPLDPHAMLGSLVDALEEAVSRRVNSVDNGEAFMASRRYVPIDMPTGYSIFETSGPWEDFSTPSRDMRMLISIDTVRLFPARARATPSRYGLPESGPALDEAVAELEAFLAERLAERGFDYTRSDGSAWSLTLADVVARREAFEMAYNPNDCVETRWAAPADSEEAAPCVRFAPTVQRERMASYRDWFRDRQRPPR